MRQLIATLVTLFMLHSAAAAQTISQSGVCYRYHFNRTGTHTPLPGVVISTQGVSTTSGANGTFSFKLNNPGGKMKMGSGIPGLSARKRGMIIFNQKAITSLCFQQKPITVVLCDADEFDQVKSRYVNEGKKKAKSDCEKKIAALEKQLNDKTISEQEYNERVMQLEDELENTRKNMDSYAEMMTRIDRSEIDSTAQRAIELFDSGQVEEAIHLLESANYRNKFMTQKANINQDKQIINNAQTALETDEKALNQTAENIRLQISQYQLTNQLDKAKELMKFLADENGTYSEHRRLCSILPPRQ